MCLPFPLVEPTRGGGGARDVAITTRLGPGNGTKNWGHGLLVGCSSAVLAGHCLGTSGGWVLGSGQVLGAGAAAHIFGLFSFLVCVLGIEPRGV